MRLWTVQPVAVWERLRSDGHVVVHPARLGADGWIHPQYSRLAGTSADADLPEPLQAELEASWRRLFRPDLPPRSWQRGDNFKGHEAVVEVLELGWVRCIKEFVGTYADLAQHSAVQCLANGP